MTPAALGTAAFLALAAIVAAARGAGWAVRRWLGQPPVVGEMIAGILLGPSLLGLVAPRAEAALFPPALTPLLYAFAQLGVGLYMFVVGLGLERGTLAGNARVAATVSLAGVAAPFAVAAALAPWLLRRPGLFGPDVGTGAATLFLGACVAVTAFPMLARIIHERGLAGTRLGTLALTAGAVDDALAWTVLALVLATLKGGAAGAGLTIGGGALLAAATLLVAPRLLRRWLPDGGDDAALLARALPLFLLMAWAMDAVGLHAAFGGFLLGTAVPRGPVARRLATMIEPLTATLLLPVFFAYSGLSTRLDLLVTPGMIGVTVAVLAGSVLAKAGACWAAARLMGEDGSTALALGALMNARGLMELIIINIGLAHGVIQAPLFAALALMAALSTLAAGPLFALAMRYNGSSTPCNRLHER